MTATQYGLIVTFQWVIVTLYLILLCLLLVNVRIILIKLQKWKNLAILFFYIWSFIAISTRLSLNIYGNYLDNWFETFGVF